MFEPSSMPRIFGMPPGADFPRALVDGVIARTDQLPAEQITRLTLYLNTARMLRRVRALFDERGARFLPRLKLITDIGRDPLVGLPPAVSSLRRRLELSQLVRGLVEYAPDFAPGTAIFDLSDSLANLMAEMHGEGVNPSVLDAAGLAENHAAHWERALVFIRIVGKFFDENAMPDAEARQRRVVEELVECWTVSPPDAPIIVAGSTGSRGATQLLMQAVARLPQGAVVLPGVDFDMPEFAWNSLYSGSIPAEDHPQFRFLRLLRNLEISPSDIQRWPESIAPDPVRNRLISLALRPAPVTDQWMDEGKKFGHIGAAIKNVSLLEAPSQRDEAVAIALMLRKAAEDGCHAALVTPDRTLARRVATSLDRWGILPDDSAGQPLAQSAPGRFLRQIAAAQGRHVSTEILLALLKHPLTATGSTSRGNHLRFSRDLELKLRRYGPPFPTATDLIAWANASGEAERIEWSVWLGSVLLRLAEASSKPLPECVECFLHTAAILAAGPGGTEDASELWREAPGRAARVAVDSLLRDAAQGGDYEPAEFSDLINGLLGQGNVPRSEGIHPKISIWGTLEARVQGADLVILGGLNEGIWPAMPAPDPWLSRQMRFKTGLLMPERQIGLAAHDFQQAVAAPKVVLSRAIRDSESETVPSRWLARLTNLLCGLSEQGGPDALEAMKARGQIWLAMAAALDEPSQKVAATPRPAPRPPVDARPRELAVTGIRTLIRDPYEIYARYILRLRPLDPLRAAPDARLRGQVLHEIVEEFVRDRPDGESEERAEERLLQIAETVLQRDIPWPSAQRLWLAKLNRVSGSFVLSEAKRSARGEPVLLEKKGSILLDSQNFTLTARPDRIDLLEDGRVHIYDYKSGPPPTRPQQDAFEKQLLLEAAMAERGAFEDLGPREVEDATYIGLGSSGMERGSDIDKDRIAETWKNLNKLISTYMKRSTGYVARRAVFEARRSGDYDHLARFGEWQMGDSAKPEDVG